MTRNPDRETTFRFKKFSVTNRHSAMKVGTDGVLLGGWVRLPDGVCSILDAGTGTGLIALMVAQRNELAEVTGVEIDPIAADEADENRSTSDFAERIKIVKADFADFTTNETFDVIVTNPPFFTETLHSPDAARAAARHADSLTLDAIFATARRILKKDGSIALVLPSDRDDDVVFAAAMYGFSPTRHCRVKTVPLKPAKRTLWEFSRSDSVLRHEDLTIRDATGEYSAEYKELLKDFYLNF